MAEKRIINLTEAEALTGGDYLAIDSATNGTRKISGSVINNAIGEVASDLATLDAEFQQFIAPSGEAPNPTEIENARVGDDGVTYTNLGTAIRTQFSDVKSALKVNTSQASARNTADGFGNLILQYSTGYWTEDSQHNLTGNSSNTKYIKANPIGGIAFTVEIKQGYGMRIIRCHQGGNGAYNLINDGYTDYNNNNPDGYNPLVLFFAANSTTEYYALNFFHTDQSTAITEEQVNANVIIKTIDVNTVNDVINSKKRVPDNCIQLPTKIEVGCYYSTDGVHLNAQYAATNFISCDGLAAVYIRTKYYRNEPYTFVYYDESFSPLLYNNQDFPTTDSIQYIRSVVPKGAKYVRCVSYIFNLDTFAVFGELAKWTVEREIENVTPNTYVNKDTGNLVSYNGACSTDYIDVEGFARIAVNSYTNSGSWYAFYDENKRYINGGSYAAPNTVLARGAIIEIDIPALAKYFRTSIYDDFFNLCYVRLIPVESDNPYLGKYFSILGDSISTFNGFIPSGNAYWYPHGDVTRVTDLWWSKLLDHFHGKLLVDEAWSGSHISGTDTSAGNRDSRCKNLGTESQDPDVIIVYMGTNDYDHDVALGTYDGHDAIPSTVATFSDAYAVTLDKILSTYKHAEVWCCTLQPMERHGQTGFPEKNNLGLTPEDYNEVIRKIAHAMNCKILEHSQCGITYYNMDEYFEDWGSSKEHPNKAGHTLIANHDKRFML